MSTLCVIPRDLFNHAKLLKCLGQLSLLIHDDKAPSALYMNVTDGATTFNVEQSLADGSFYCTDILVRRGGPGMSRRTIWLSSPSNDRSPYPLTFEFDDDEGSVFNDDGTLHDDFLALFDL